MYSLIPKFITPEFSLLPILGLKSNQENLYRMKLILHLQKAKKQTFPKILVKKNIEHFYKKMLISKAEIVQIRFLWLPAKLSKAFWIV